jgi:hypothetical protein
MRVAIDESVLRFANVHDSRKREQKHLLLLDLSGKLIAGQRIPKFYCVHLDAPRAESLGT